MTTIEKRLDVEFWLSYAGQSWASSPWLCPRSAASAQRPGAHGQAEGSSLAEIAKATAQSSTTAASRAAARGDSSLRCRSRSSTQATPTRRTRSTCRRAPCSMYRSCSPITPPPIAWGLPRCERPGGDLRLLLQPGPSRRQNSSRSWSTAALTSLGPAYVVGAETPGLPTGETSTPWRPSFLTPLSPRTHTVTIQARLTGEALEGFVFESELT